MIRKRAVTPEDLKCLASLAVKDEQLQDDFCDYSKVVVKKPWGYEYLIFNNGHVSVWILYLKSGAQTSMHCHPNKKTSLVVLQGRVTSSTLSEDIELSAGEGILIDKKAFHMTTATHPDGAFVMEIETPVNKRDLVRLKDKYGREGQGYEGSDQHSRNIQNYNYLSLSGPEVHYNLKKRLGDCTLTFKKVEGQIKLSELGELQNTDVFNVLRGRIRGTDGKVLFEVGDTTTVGDLRKAGELTAEESVDLLLIKRMDHQIKVSDYIAEFLSARGIKNVFLVPGDANVHLLDSIGRDEHLSFVGHQLEREASLAAEAYSKLTGELSCLVLSCGASGPNALPGIANAWIDSTPVLVISGQARSDQNDDGRVRQLGNKSFNITELVGSITKYAVKITDENLIRYHLEKAVALALEGRAGPVWLDIPIDILGMTVDKSNLKAYSEAPNTKKTNAREALATQVREVKRLIQSSKRPVLLVGNGVRLSKGEEVMRALINRLQVPVLTSRRGADLLPETQPFFFGRPGTFGQRRANFIVQNSDLLISIGSRLSVPLIGRNTEAFARAAKKVVVDIDLNELEKSTIKPDISVHQSAKDFMESLFQELEGYTPQHYDWIKRCTAWKEKFPPMADGYEHKKYINPYLFIKTLSDCMQEQDCIVVDGGAVMHIFTQVFEFKTGQRLVSSTGLEYPGFALAGSIGARTSSPASQRIICLCEDRGLQVSIQELQTIMDYKLPITIFVLRSKGHSTVRKIQSDFFGKRFVGTDNDLLVTPPKLCKIAQVYGFQTVQFESPEKLHTLVTDVLKMKGPVLCEVEVDSEQELAPRMGFEVKDDGKWVAKPLEDMYPFLDRSVLKEEMIIDLLQED